MADYGALTKVLYYDIAQQLRIVAAVASVDASNCYDRAANAIASLIFQVFGVKSEVYLTMLECIQNMRFYLRTAFGDSKEFAGSSILAEYQGLCDGNGAALSGFGAIGIVILNYHKAKGHGAKFWHWCPR